MSVNSMSDTFDDVIGSDHVRLIEQIVTPLTPYVLCDHFVSTEVHPWDHKYVDFSLDLSRANDLVAHKNYQDIRHLDIICVQVDWFDLFCDEILPRIEERKIQVILITSQWHLPQIHRSAKTDKLLANDAILLWISQNPIYVHHKKYMAFPYGIRPSYVHQYIDFVKSFDLAAVAAEGSKSIKILNQCSTVHPQLPWNHIRRNYKIFGVDSGHALSYTEFLGNISRAEFVISTPGDRDDCYRHYECIGLNAIPVSNIAGGYPEIFEEDMVYSQGDDMKNSVVTQTISNTFHKTNRDRLTVAFWVRKMNERVASLRET